MKFLHISDIHLGCRRYNLEERTQDFFRAWYEVILRHAIPNEVDFVLIAGDFFNARKVDPQTMNHAMAGLNELREAGIPVLAIEGNHDQHEAMNTFSWLRSLSQWGFLKLLEPARNPEGGFRFVPWNEEERSGSYIDVAGARIFGSHWYGMSANAAIPMLTDALRDVRQPGLFHILMLHTDVEGQINRPIPALSIAKLKELRTQVDYVALGHTHKRFELEDWAFNPGSLEACTIDEYKEERGAYLIEVDDEHRVTARHIRDYTQRPFQRLSYDVSGATEPEEVHAGIMETISREARRHDAESEAPAPIIEISLKGHLGFKNSLLNLSRMREEARELTGALHVMIRNQSVPVEYASEVNPELPRHERERRIIEDLIVRDTRFRPRAQEMAALVIEAKRQVLSDEAPEKILDLIEQSLQQKATGATEAPQLADEAEIIVTASARQAIERNAGQAISSQLSAASEN